MIIHSLRSCIVAGLVVLSLASARSQVSGVVGLTYLSPRPGAVFVNARTTLAFRSIGPIRRESLSGKIVSLRGSSSGEQRSTMRLARDGATVLCVPGTPFEPGETVTAALPGGIQTSAGVVLEPFSYTFTISPLRDPIRRRPEHRGYAGATAGMRESAASVSPRPGLRPLDLPEDYPPVRVLRNASHKGDPLFLDNFSWGPEETVHYIMILYRDGSPAFYRKQFAWDFKRQPNGLLTYYDQVAEMYYGLDSAYQIVDSFDCGNGYNTNEHELQVLPDGRAFVMAYEAQMIALDTVVEGGNPDAMVWGLIVQEIDRDKNVTFEWRSWDHFKLTDATQEDFAAPILDYVHGNSICVDTDSTIILSSRNMDEVTKISRVTGEIIWRMGGKNNQFILHDPVGWFDHQHTAYRLPNGNLTVFDNGPYRGYSRAVEYALDESTKVATKVWEYDAGTSILGWAMGNVQRLPNGNTLIGWGSSNPNTVEVTPGGTVVHEMDMREFEYTYRVFSFPWQTNAFVPAHDTVHIGPVSPGDSLRTGLVITNPTAYDVILTSFRTRTASFAVDTTGGISLPAGGSFTLPLRFAPGMAGTVTDTLEIRSEDSTQGIVRRVVLRGEAILPTITASPATLHFGSVAFDSTVVRTLGITLTTPSAVRVDSIKARSSSLTLSRSSLLVTAPDTLQVIFVSTVEGSLVDTLVFYGDSARVLLRVPVDATVLPAPPRSTIVAGPAVLHFGNITRDSTARRTVLLTTTTAAPVAVDSIRVASSVFSVNKRQFVVTASDSVTVTCTPRTAGVWRDTILFLGDSMQVLLRVPVDVNSLPPSLLFRPAPLLFSGVKTGDSTFLPVAVVNTSGTAARIDSAHVGTGTFGLFAFLPALVPPYDSLQILVRFHPAAVSAYRDTLTVFTEIGVFGIPISGTGTDPLLGTGPDGSAVPAQYQLSMNFPNPFNPSTTLSLGLPVASTVSVIIYDALGREVAVLARGMMEPGFRRLTWNAGQAASGLYLCRCSAIPVNGTGADGFVTSRKLLLVR